VGGSRGRAVVFFFNNFLGGFSTGIDRKKYYKPGGPGDGKGNDLSIGSRDVESINTQPIGKDFFRGIVIFSRRLDDCRESEFKGYHEHEGHAHSANEEP
jgi:hypothetical protein